MINKPRFRVAVAGLDLRDVRLIEIVFKHSQYNRYEFVLVNHIAVGEVDLLIANAHDSDGNAAISALRQSEVPIPVIAAVPRGESSASKHAISIDRLTLQLLPIMNRVVELDLLSPDTQPMDSSARANLAAAERSAHVNQSHQGSFAANSSHQFNQSPATPSSHSNQKAPDIYSRPWQSPSAAQFGQRVESKFSLSQTGDTAAQNVRTNAPVNAPTNVPTNVPTTNQSSFNATPQLRSEQPAQVSTQQRSTVSPTQFSQPIPAVHRPNLVAFPGSKKAGEALRVMVVDDSPTVRTQLGGALEKMGFIVETAATGADALQKLDKMHFDLALVDVIMPEMDGYKLTREIKKDKKRRSMPVIILTSKSSPFDLARGALAGCDSFLTKPVPLKDLQTAIIKHLRKSLAIDDLSGLLNLAPAKQTPALRDANSMAS